MATQDAENRIFCAICEKVALAGFVTFGLSVIASLAFFGGLTALNGKIEGERATGVDIAASYFIGGHGTFREVTEQQFETMLTVEKIVLLMWVLAFIAAVIIPFIPGCRERSRTRR